MNLGFEEEDQLKDPARLRAFIQRYGITYPVLVAGTPDELNEKIPQADRLNCWPTSFILGRDGRVRGFTPDLPDPRTHPPIRPRT